jgi:hypothetical protein
LLQQLSKLSISEKPPGEGKCRRLEKVMTVGKLRVGHPGPRVNKVEPDFPKFIPQGRYRIQSGPSPHTNFAGRWFPA